MKKERIILIKMVNYADRISSTIDRYELNYEKFINEDLFCDAISMCLLQIGELANKLPKELRQRYSTINWQKIVSVRNRAAHGYDEMDFEVVWEIATKKIPELKKYCKKILEEIENVES